MSSEALVCKKRDMALKAKAIRKDGFVPAVVYGRHIDSLSIQIEQRDAAKFMQHHSVGSKVTLNIDGEDQMAIFKDYHSDPLSGKLLHIDFHALKSGEKIKVALPINILNRDSINQDTFLQEQLNEIEISTLPQYLVDYISVDVSKYSLGDSVYVSDLDVFSDENIEVLTPADTLVCSLTHVVREVEEPEEEETDEAAEPTEESEEPAE